VETVPQILSSPAASRCPFFDPWQFPSVFPYSCFFQKKMYDKKRVFQEPAPGLPV
jgi:hypothetical protein